MNFLPQHSKDYTSQSDASLNDGSEQALARRTPPRQQMRNSYVNKKFVPRWKKPEVQCCQKCGMTGHSIEQCRVKNPMDMARIQCRLCGKMVHFQWSCQDNRNACRKCGQVGHWASRCPGQGPVNYVGSAPFYPQLPPVRPMMPTGAIEQYLQANMTRDHGNIGGAAGNSSAVTSNVTASQGN